MITMSFVDLPSAHWHWVCVFNASFGSTPKQIPGVLLSTNDPLPAESIEYNLGRLTQDDKAYGTLRDKGVKHLNCSGTIVCSESSYQHGVNTAGYPLFKKPDGTYIPFTHVLAWGDSHDYTETWYPPSYTSGSYTYTMPGGMTLTRKFHWDGNKWLSVLTTVKTATYRNGSLYLSGTTSSIITRWRRAPTVSYALYYMGQSTVARVPTGTDLANAFALIGTSGGSIDADIYPVEGSALTRELFYSYIASAVEAEYRSLDLFSQTDPFADFGQLSVECAAQLKYVDSNVLGLCFDVTEWRALRNLFKTLTSASEWIDSVETFKRIIRQRPKEQFSLKSLRKDGNLVSRFFSPLSSVYLGTKYGVLPTVSDIGRLRLGVERFSLFLKLQRIHSRRITSIDFPDSIAGTHTAVLTAVVHEFPSNIVGGAMRCIAGLKNWGLYPELTNLWDRLAYSFVADWFVQFGDLFEECDTYLNVKDYFPIKYCIISEKWDKSKSINSMVPANVPATGEVHFSYYVREIKSELPLPPVSLTTETRLGLHSVEATALVLQRLR